MRISVEALAALANDFVAGRAWNEMGETLHRHGVAVMDGGLDGFGDETIRAMKTASRLRHQYLRRRPRQGQMAI